MDAGNDFQSLAGQQGRDFETVVIFWLQAQGWTILRTLVRIDGIEIDIEAADPSGMVWWIECKGSHRIGRPGLLRTDTVKKAVAVAYHLYHSPDLTPPYMVAASHPPKLHSSGWQMLNRALEIGAIVRIVYPFTDEKGMAR